jgi:hypothetical protein
MPSLSQDECDTCQLPVHYNFDQSRWVHGGDQSVVHGHEAEPYDLQKCHLCGEHASSVNNPLAEMYYPLNPEAPAEIVHAECGLAKGMDIA